MIMAVAVGGLYYWEMSLIIRRRSGVPSASAARLSELSLFCSRSSLDSSAAASSLSIRGGKLTVTLILKTKCVETCCDTCSSVSRSMSRCHHGGQRQCFCGHFINIIAFKLNNGSVMLRMDGKSIYDFIEKINFLLFSFGFFFLSLANISLGFTQKPGNCFFHAEKNHENSDKTFFHIF